MKELKLSCKTKKSSLNLPVRIHVIECRYGCHLSKTLHLSNDTWTDIQHGMIQQRDKDKGRAEGWWDIEWFSVPPPSSELPTPIPISQNVRKLFSVIPVILILVYISRKTYDKIGHMSEHVHFECSPYTTYSCTVILCCTINLYLRIVVKRAVVLSPMPTSSGATENR